MKRIVLFLLAVMIASSAEGYGTFSGEWELYGEGFAEKGFVRMSLEIDGDMNISVSSLSGLPASVVNVVSDDWETVISRDEAGFFYDCLTGLDMNLRVYASSLGMKIYDDYMPNGITEPYLMLDFIPSLNEPLVLPDLPMEGMLVRLTLTSENAGKVWIRGNINTSYAGEIELNTECAIWKKGTERPGLDNGGKSGCDSGVGTIAVMILLAGVKRFVRN